LATIGPIAQPRNCSPEAGAEHDRSSKPVRPNSFTNLGHNLVTPIPSTNITNQKYFTGMYTLENFLLKCKNSVKIDASDSAQE
jgi:hypothetical protein